MHERRKGWIKFRELRLLERKYIDVHKARWPSGLRRQTKDQDIRCPLISGPKGRGFESHSRHNFFSSPSGRICDPFWEFAMISAPSPASPTFRADLAKLVSPLKRIRPRVPFRQLAAHRIPTLSLYRGLLRNAATDDVCVPGLRVGALADVPFVKPRFGSECGCCSEGTCI